MKFRLTHLAASLSGQMIAEDKIQLVDSCPAFGVAGQTEAPATDNFSGFVNLRVKLPLDNKFNKK